MYQSPYCSLSLHLYLLYLLLDSCDGNDAFWLFMQFLQQETPNFISSDLCPPNSPVDPETRLTTEYGDWCRNVYTLYKTHVRDTSDLMQRINDTWASISQNVEAVDQRGKRLCVCMHEGKMTPLWISAKLKPALFRATNSLPRKTRYFASFPSQLFKSK